MALDVTVLTNEIQAAYDAESDKDIKPTEARSRMASAIAKAIDKYVRGGDISTIVNTTGTASAQTGTGKGKIT